MALGGMPTRISIVRPQRKSKAGIGGGGGVVIYSSHVIGYLLSFFSYSQFQFLWSPGLQELSRKAFQPKTPKFLINRYFLVIVAFSENLWQHFPRFEKKQESDEDTGKPLCDNVENMCSQFMNGMVGNACPNEDNFFLFRIFLQILPEPQDKLQSGKKFLPRRFSIMFLFSVWAAWMKNSAIELKSHLLSYGNRYWASLLATI